jgi:hypothetical protein
MKLFLVHCGFYDPQVSNGLYEFHVNLLVAAESFEVARMRAKIEPEFIRKRMHIDGIQMIEAVKGYRLGLSEDLALEGQTLITLKHHRDLAPTSAGP